MWGRIRNYLLYYGLNKEEYQSCVPEMQQSNCSILTALSLIVAVGMTVLNLLEQDTAYSPFRMFGTVCFFALALLIHRGGRRSLALTRIVLYLAVIVAIMVSGMQGIYLNSEMYSTIILVVLSGLPILLMDCPLVMGLILLVCTGGYIVLAWQHEPYSIAYGDTVNAIVTFIWGVAAHYGMGRIRMKGILSRFELAKRDARNEEVMENIPAGIVIMEKNMQGVLAPTFYSRSFMEMCHLTPEKMQEMYGGDAYRGVHPDDREWVKKVLEERSEARRFSVSDYRLASGKGGYIWVSVELHQKESEEKGQVYYAVYRDTTKEHKLSDKLSEATASVREEQRNRQILADALEAAQQANRAKSDFLSNMSHEIRTPMNAIIGITDLASDDLQNPEKMAQDLEKISSSARYLLSLINDILDMSRIESGRMPLNQDRIVFSEFIREINDLVTTQAEEKAINYEVKIGNVERVYIGDRLKLQQILVNILSNAVKFTPGGGHLWFEVSQPMARENHAVLQFTIRDDGIGMDEKFLPKLFKAFSQEHSGTTSKYGGTGLGLAISRNLAEMMHGNIEVHSKKGEGTEFVVEVEVERQAIDLESRDVNQPGTDGVSKSEQGEKSRSELAHNSLDGKHILLAEDHPLNVEVAKRLLQKKGIISSVAENGQKAVEMYEQAPEGTYDAVLMDVRMPVMDGLSAAAAIRQVESARKIRVPIIAMTANAFEEDIRKSKKAGMDAHLAKPINPQMLYSELEKCILSMQKEA